MESNWTLDGLEAAVPIYIQASLILSVCSVFHWQVYFSNQPESTMPAIGQARWSDKTSIFLIRCTSCHLLSYVLAPVSLRPPHCKALSALTGAKCAHARQLLIPGAHVFRLICSSYCLLNPPASDLEIVHSQVFWRMSPFLHRCISLTSVMVAISLLNAIGLSAMV